MEGGERTRGSGGVGEGGVPKTPDLQGNANLGKAMVVVKRIDHSFASVVMERRRLPICILFLSLVLLMYNLSVSVNV
jgi:hypothetical protein